MTKEISGIKLFYWKMGTNLSVN